jgi:hypothetical protein
MTISATMAPRAHEPSSHIAKSHLHSLSKVKGDLERRLEGVVPGWPVLVGWGDAMQWLFATL